MLFGSYGISLGIYCMCVCHIRMTPRCVLMRELAFHAHTRYTHMPPPPSPIGWYIWRALFCLILIPFFSCLFRFSMYYFQTTRRCYAPSFYKRGSSLTTVSHRVVSAWMVPVASISCPWPRTPSPLGGLTRAITIASHRKGA